MVDDLLAMAHDAKKETAVRRKEDNRRIVARTRALAGYWLSGLQAEERNSSDVISQVRRDIMRTMMKERLAESVSGQRIRTVGNLLDRRREIAPGRI